MKKSIILILAIISFSFLTNDAFADVLSGPSCTVTARVIDSGTETRKLSGANGKISEYESKYLKLEVLDTKRVGLTGDCSFVAVGNVFKIDGGSNPDPLKVGDTIKSGVELNSSMGPSGVVPFIQWEPISFVGLEKSLPPAFELQSDDKPERSIAQPDVVAKNSKNEVDISNTDDKKVAPITGEDIPSSTGLIIVFVAVLILAGGSIYYFISRQRKT